MKIGIISNVYGYSWAGSEETWKSAAEFALNHRHEVSAFLHPDIGNSLELAAFRRKGGKVRSWKPCPVARLQPIKDFLLPTFSPKQLDAFDVILVSLGSLPALTYVPGLCEGLLQTTTRVHLLCQFNADHLPLSPDERNLIRSVVERSERMIFVSEANLHTARRQLALPLAKAMVLSNPARLRLPHPLPWLEEGEKASFACVARLETYWKGQDILLDVFSRPQWRERDWQLQLYGTGPDGDYLRELIGFYGLQHRVSLAGYERDLQKIWKSNHLLILPSHGEGTPLALIEAMAMGRPALVTNVGGNSAMVHESVTGFVAEAATVPCLNSALERAWENRSQWRSMGERAHGETAGLTVEKILQPLFDVLLNPGS